MDAFVSYGVLVLFIENAVLLKFVSMLCSLNKLYILTLLFIKLPRFYSASILLCWMYFANIDFYRASICDGGLGSRNSVHLSVHLSVTRVDCD